MLDALPIGAAIIERDGEKSLKVMAYNSRFLGTVEQSSCEALGWDDAECLKAGPIADLVQKFFDGTDVTGELDFKDGEGVSSHYFRLKLAPFPRRNGKYPRCLLSVVDRTVEVQAERTLRAEMLRDSLTGLPNRLAFTEAIEKAGETVARDLEHAVLVVDMLRFSRINESMGSLAGDELLITFARRLILALQRRRRACPHRRQRVRRAGLAPPRGRGRAESGRTHPEYHGDSVQDLRPRDPRRVRHRRCADECRAGPGGAVPQRAVRGQAGEARGQAAGL